MPGKSVSDTRIIEALYKTAGITAKATAYLHEVYGIKITRNAVWKRIIASETLKEAQISAREIIVDAAESSILRAVREGDVKASIFVLKTLGKDRGYGMPSDPHPPVIPDVQQIQILFRAPGSDSVQDLYGNVVDYQAESHDEDDEESFDE